MHRPASLVSILVALAFYAVPAQQAKAPPASAHSSNIEPGEFFDNVYRNSGFGFTCSVPYGWVDRTDTMRESSDDSHKASVLLGAFERPPEATGSTVNSSVVIAAEAASAYPGIKHAAQYFGPLNEVTNARGLTKVNEVYEFPVDGKPIVREDFIKRMGAVALHQSTLAWLTRGYVVSFTFMGSDDDEVQHLIEGLKFGYSVKPAKSKPQASNP